MKKNRILALTGAACLSVALLAGCGSNNNTGEIKAKLDPRYAGILPLQIKRYISVPMPLNSSTVAGLM